MRLSNKKGFSLVEALFASVIMAIGLFAVIAAIYSRTTILNKNREQTIATLAAQGEIENIRGMKFSDILALTSFDEDDAPGLAYLHYGAGYGNGSIAVDPVVVDPDGFDGNSNIKKVSVTVTWKSVNGKQLQKTMTTLMTKDGINKPSIL